MQGSTPPLQDKKKEVESNTSLKHKEDLSEFKIFINKLKRSFTRDAIVRKIKGQPKNKEDFLRVHKLPLAV